MFVPSPVLLALAQAAPERVMAEGAGAVWTMQVKGRYADGRSFVSSMFNHAGGTGARASKDGLSATAYPTGVSAVPVEVMEATAPLLFERRELRTDSGGSGKYRGGLGQTVEFSIRTGQEWLLNALVDRTRRPARGLFGGRHGASGRISLRSGRRVATKQRNLLRADEVVVLELPGGAGYGPAAERDAAAVLEDVREGFVSPAMARDVYGVNSDGCKSESKHGKEVD
jgi:N-methylhydantoinase B/oxoprolinase/acetone carboxylase alpha subunit